MRIAFLLLFLLLLGCKKEDISYEMIDDFTVSSTVSEPKLLKTLPASWDENWYASPVVFDLNNDHKKEIVASRHSVLYVWNTDGSLLWRAPVGENASISNDHGSYRMYASPAVGDFDADGFGEIAIAYNNKAAVYEHDGSLKSGWPQTFPGSDGEIRSIAAADLEKDGTYEILTVKTNKGPVTNVWEINGAIRNGWPQVDDAETKYDYGGYNQNIGVADLNGDGKMDIISTYDICHLGVFKDNGESWIANPIFNTTYSCRVPMFHDISLAIQGWGEDGKDRDEFTDSPPVFADLDKDGNPEIILFSDHERAGEYINRGNSLWALNPDMTRVNGFNIPPVTAEPIYTGYENNIVQVAPVPSISKFGTEEIFIVVPSYDGNMYCYSEAGEQIWKRRFDKPGGVFIGASEAAIGDLNNDGVPEIVFTTYSTEENISKLYILNKDGDMLYNLSINGRGSMSAPTLDDIDGDQTIEIIISLKDAVGGNFGGVQIWKVSSAKMNVLDWPTGRGNYLRTGEYN